MSKQNCCTYPIQCIQPDTQRISCFQPRKQKMKKIKKIKDYTNRQKYFFKIKITFNILHIHIFIVFLMITCGWQKQMLNLKMFYGFNSNMPHGN